MTTHTPVPRSSWPQPDMPPRIEPDSLATPRWAFTFGADHHLIVGTEFAGLAEAPGIPLARRYVLLRAAGMTDAINAWVTAFGPGSFGEVYPWDEVTKAKLEGWGLTELGLFR